MRIFFLVGSLTVGATLAFSLTQFDMLARAVGGASIVVGILGVWFVARRNSAVKPRFIYSASNDADEYTESDVREFFRAFSEAKARSAAPFPLPKSNHDEPSHG